MLPSCARQELCARTDLVPPGVPPTPPLPPCDADWQQLHAGRGAAALRELLQATSDASSMHVGVENRLGVDAAMELDFGDHL